MRIVTLMENTAVSQEFKASHGLSFYIETSMHRILFDMGPDDGFLENARRLGVRVEDVDIAFLSHGHYDHGGGLAAFMEVNKKAVIYVQRQAFGEYFAHDPDGRIRYIGLPKEFAGNSRFAAHTGDYVIDKELMVFSGVTGRECYSPANDSLFLNMNGHHVPDLFMHEQSLLIKDKEKCVLISGCAHSGIVNIVKKAGNAVPHIHCVAGGMHLRHAFEDREQLRSFCKKLSKRLLETGSRYYTCHCTGEEAYMLLKEEMGERIGYLAAGSQLEI